MMTQEEQQAYFEKQRQERLNNCRIKTQEEFIEECRKADIQDSWYAFTEDNSKPVYMNENTVFYGEGGKTIVSYDFQRWDTAFEQLLRYKQKFLWEQSGELYKIDDIKWQTNANISSFGSGHSSLTIRKVAFTKEEEKALLADGWIYGNYDQYMCYTNFYKTVNIEELKSVIVFEFTKITDERDRKEFGFKNTSMSGSYQYPVPKDMKEYITSSVRRKGEISESLKDMLKRRFEKNLLEDEFRGLLQLKNLHRQALFDAINSSLSVKEQKDAFAEAGNRVVMLNPATDNYFHSRSWYIRNENFDLAYAKTGIV